MTQPQEGIIGRLKQRSAPANIKSGRSGRLRVITFEHRHIDEAAKLFTDNYRALRSTIPYLPAAHESREAAASLLTKALGRVPGVAALENDRLIGYMFGFVIDLHGMRTAYVPDWGHAAVPAESGRINEQLYANLVEDWVANGCFRHAVAVFANEREALETYVRLGFGMLVIDAIRGVEPAVGPVNIKVKLRRATKADAEVCTTLGGELDRYLARPPIFLARTGIDAVENNRGWLADSENLRILAFEGEEAVGFMQFEPKGHGTAHIVGDKKSYACTGGYVRPDKRRQGIGAALLTRCAEWAGRHGYGRMSVDCESANIRGSSFWLKHFEPVCYSMMRTVDEQIAWAHAERDARDIW